ncbi:MAG: DEAD/DEAH box helicase [Candidatus Cohnella colombiensis]|uniref:DEAD/DEAH box helicase n=1 Tax=Candidatus Cohnella colombiensis TaxID=3121368 RepID=A0AA95EVF0_9BACL|nr:MAG: DEAD/DEAH box helicase [Cohnella sp.]
MTDFLELGVSEERIRVLRVMGITSPTPVQAETIPIVYQGKDVISQAQTGTGKTLAFVLPMLDKINIELPEVQGLIVTPTRELAIQITTEIKKLLDPRGAIKVLAVYGGQDVEAQLHKLKGQNHIVVATPGRLLDHLRRETISLAGVKMLVLDEADQMLHMGFLKEVDEILRQTPYKKQAMLFSATMPPSIREMAGRILRNPEHVTVKSERVTVKDIRQWAIETTDRAKQKTLVQLLEVTQPYLSIIFCRTKRRASALNLALQEMGYASDELHGDLSQAKREKVMKQFREARLQLLVATDVAARGLDVEGVTHVFNYDIPQDVESYIHRIGRTGRAGESGLAITVYTSHDRRELADIENGIELVMERRDEEGNSLGGGGLESSRSSGGFGRVGGGGRGSESSRPGGRGGRGEGRNAGRGESGGRSSGGGGRSGGRGRSSDARSGAGRGGLSAGQAKGRSIEASKARSGKSERSASVASEGRTGGRSSKPAVRENGDPTWSVGAPAQPRKFDRGSRDSGGSAGRGGRDSGGRDSSGGNAGRGGRDSGGRNSGGSAGRGGRDSSGGNAGRGGRESGGGRGTQAPSGGGNRGGRDSGGSRGMSGSGGRPANKRAPRGR